MKSRRAFCEFDGKNVRKETTFSLLSFPLDALESEDREDRDE